MADLRDRWAAAVINSSLGDHLKVTCWAIREYANRSGQASMGIAALATNRGISTRQIKRHLNDLVGGGWLTREAGKGVKGAGGTTALTSLAIPDSRDTQGVTSEGSRSGVALNGTTSNHEACRPFAEVVTATSPRRDALNVPQTNKTISKPGASARAAEGARQAVADPEHVKTVLDRMRRNFGSRGTS